MRVHVLVHHSLEFGFNEQKFTQKSGVSLLDSLSFFEHFVHFVRFDWVDLTLFNGVEELFTGFFLLGLNDLDEVV